MRMLLLLHGSIFFQMSMQGGINNDFWLEYRKSTTVTKNYQNLKKIGCNFVFFGKNVHPHGADAGSGSGDAGL